MNTPTLLVAAIVAGAAAGAASQLALSPRAAAPPAPGPGLEPDSQAALLAALEDLRASDGALRRELDALRSDLVAPRPRIVPTAATPVEATVPEPAVAETELDLAEVSAEDLAAQLFDSNLSHDQRQLLWRQLQEAGRLDEVIAALESRADLDPNDPALQVELAEGYITKIQEVGNGPLAGKWADKADAAYDRALELDPQHWEARFSKAVALSFWPPIFGKQNEAVRQFETLLAQQAGLTPDPSHAQTHLLLGNLYQQVGQPDKALATWQQGAQLFPDDQGLAGQVELMGGGQ